MNSEDFAELIKLGTYTRDYRQCSLPSSLNPAIAFAMNHLAGLEEGDRILDPCCGSGTILIERQLLKPGICIGVDIDPRALDCAKENLTALHQRHPKLVSGSLELKHGDITFKKFPDNYFTKFISNLPFGIHAGSRDKNKVLYRFLADESIKWLKPGGTAIFFTNAKTLLKNSFSYNPDWKLIEEIKLNYSGLTPSVFVYQKLN